MPTASNPQTRNRFTSRRGVSRDWPRWRGVSGTSLNRASRSMGREPLDSSRFGSLWKDDRMKLLLRILVAAAALGVATWLVPGIELRAGSTTSKVLTLIVVALIVGVVNA